MNADEQLSKTHYSREGEHLVLEILVELRRREGRKRIVAQAVVGNAGGRPESPGPTHNESLCLAIARGHQFLALLESGAGVSIPELSKRFNVDGAYVRRLLRLTLLAPEIIEAILGGNEPPGLSLERLRSISLVWDDQRAALWSGSKGMESRNDALPGD